MTDLKPTTPAPDDDHELEGDGQPIHVDVDPFIPTGICAICKNVPQETEPPEDRPTEAASEAE